MSCKILVVDDESPSRGELEYLISKVSREAEIFTAEGSEEALEIIGSNHIDAAFIDINMPGMDGITLAREMAKLNRDIKIVFATAYDLYAVKAFELNAADYILKPFEEERIRLTIGKIFRHKTEKAAEAADTPQKNSRSTEKKVKKLSVWKGDRVILIDIKEIVYIMADERNSIIKTVCGEYLCNQSISHLEEKLESESFFRIHRSYLINLEHVKEIQPWFNNGYIVIMDKYEKDEVPVSRKQLKDFKELFEF